MNSSLKYQYIIFDASHLVVLLFLMRLLLHQHPSEEDDVLSEEEEEEGEEVDHAGSTMEFPVLETELVNQELEQTIAIGEEFAEVDGGNEKTEEELKDKKVEETILLCILSCHVVLRHIYTYYICIYYFFPIQVAVYTRQELNIRITANFLLALAANQPSTKSHVRRYFCAAVQLPSDWLEVVRLYSTVSLRERPLRSLPMCLKKAMADKFKQFSEYQLAKYNTRKHRCKHNCNRPKVLTGSSTPHLIRCFFCYLKSLQLESSKVVVDKKQSEFSMKKMIKKLHIKEPAEHVMAILGRKYPGDAKAFTHSGMKGVWDRERAGQRMKLKEPETWERLLSMEGNKAATWEKLIDNKSLPFMAMLRNLRNMITRGISEAHHKKILSRLTNKKAVIQSRQFPFRFLAAYKVIMELHTLGDQRLYSVDLLGRYLKALETAVQISCRYNVPPLPGRTVILLSTNMSTDHNWSQKQDFCLPPDPEQKQEKEEEEEEEEKKEISDSQDASHQRCVCLSLLKVFKSCYFSQIDNIIILAESWLNHDVEYTIDTYRKEINSKVLEVQVFMSHTFPKILKYFCNHVIRFVAERGSSRLLDHVEHLDKLYNIAPPEGAKGTQTTSSLVPIPASPKLRWQGVRVFISSTFRDMHAERDILVRSVFPELRRRAAPHCLYLQEVELRWGVTEEESGRTTELCLSEVCRSQMMVGILGERYGLVPPKPVLPDLPQYTGRYTYLNMKLSVKCISIQTKSIVSLFLRSVPVAWKSDFVPESKEAESKMAALKSRIRASDVKVTENYPCEWGGVVEGKPYLKNLEDFGKAVLEDLWMAVLKQFVEVSFSEEVHQGALQRQFFGRAKLLSGAVEMVEQVQTKGGMMVVEGGPGEGKTVFMVNVLKTSACQELDRSNNKDRESPECLQLLNEIKLFYIYTEKESPLPHSYKELLSEFHSLLSDVKQDKPVVLVVDGVDAVRDGGGQLTSDWIPQQLCQLCLVVSIPSKAALLQTLAKKRSAVLFTLGQLTVPDRKEIVQRGLDTFGKKLSDSAFNNQVLSMCYNSIFLYTNVFSICFLPNACVFCLVQHSLDRLCSQYRGMLGLRWALAALTVSPAGKRSQGEI
uniref:TROVE domain-containing protein n=1 Tax=Lates calcarifer TaxID=8187 RepID=A0A4W6BKJ4_LATCA